MSPFIAASLTRTAVARPARREGRLLVWVLAAAALHSMLTLLGSSSAAQKPRELPLAREVALLFPVVVEPPPVGEGEAPGGGSPTPDPESQRAARPERREAAAQKAPEVTKAPVVRESAALGTVVEELDDSPEPVAAEELVAIEARPELAEVPSTEQPPSTRFTATAPRVAQTSSALSALKGYGPGDGTGPGGTGRGYGRGDGTVKERFAFGGPSGAFRADVCFIPATTKSLREIPYCRPEVSFFTDALDVSPRPFTQGFPGVTERTEWFAMEIKGIFQVKQSDYYTFRLLSDDGSLLYIDGYLIIDLDGQHPATFKDATIPLEAGAHRLFVKYYQGPRDRIALQLHVSGPNGVRKLLGPEI